MKQLYSTAIALFFFLTTFAAPVDSVIINNGKWNQSATWSLGRLPIDGDTVVVPLNKSVVVDANIMNSNNYYIEVLGTLLFNGGKLDMGVNSKVFVAASGLITGSGANDALRINNVDKFKGNQANITGPSLAMSSTAVAPNGFTSITNSALPVVFIGFNIARQSNDVLVQFSTAQEANSSRFEIERSEDGTNWNAIATLTAAGNSTTVQTYSYTDRNVTAKTAYYRVKQEDIDGRFIYTSVKSIKNTVSGVEVKVAAVAQNKIVLQFNQQVKSEVAVRIISLNGAVMEQQNLNQPVGQVIVNTNSLRGNYIVSITNNQDVNTHSQFLF